MPANGRRGFNSPFKGLMSHIFGEILINLNDVIVFKSYNVLEWVNYIVIRVYRW